MRLWLSQVFSAVGDSLCMIAITWLSVKTAGPAAGFVSGAGSVAGMCLGLVAGVYADRWNRRTTMVAVDVLRAMTVLSLVLINHYTPLTLWHFGVAAIIVASLNSLFDPSLQASLPELTGSEDKLQAMNSLMQINHRLARILGPALAGCLVLVVPIIHFFTVDAISFLVSAIAILSISKTFKWKHEAAETSKAGLSGVLEDIRKGTILVIQHQQLLWSLSMYIVCCFAWSAGFVVGFPLLALQMPHSDISTYATLVTAYGIGSVTTYILIGAFPTRRRMLRVSISNIIFFVGFTIVALAPNLFVACLGAALSAVGGPIGDITILVMMQTDMPRKDLGKVYSLYLFVVSLGSAIGLLLSPLLFSSLGAKNGILFCAITFGIGGLIGLLKFGFKEAPHVPKEALEPRKNLY